METPVNENELPNILIESPYVEVLQAIIAMITISSYIEKLVSDKLKITLNEANKMNDETKIYKEGF